MDARTRCNNVLKALLWDSAFAFIPPILLFTVNPGTTLGPSAGLFSLLPALFQLHRQHRVLHRSKGMGGN